MQYSPRTDYGDSPRMSATSPSRSFSPSRQSTGLYKTTASKLEHVAERFSSFYNDLEQEKQQRRIAETTRYQLLNESIVKLEKSLEAEIKRRAESDKQLQSHLETEIKSVQDRLSLQVSEMQHTMKTTVDGLQRTVQDLQTVIKEERVQRQTDIEHLAHSLVAKVNECVAALDDERVSRLEREAGTLKRVGEDIYRVSEKLDAEKALREAELAQLRSEVHEALGNRNLTDEKFQAVVLDEIATLKSAVTLEREERIAEDDEIVQAVNDYTRALQDGLRLVANSKTA